MARDLSKVDCSIENDTLELNQMNNNNNIINNNNSNGIIVCEEGKTKTQHKNVCYQRGNFFIYSSFIDYGIVICPYPCP